MSALLAFWVPAIVFLLTVACGFWLSRRGKPYNGALFNVHKLAALAAVVLLAVQMANALKGVEGAAAPIALVALATVCAIALFATGALMSLGKLSHRLMVTIHRVAPPVMMAALGAAVYLLGARPH